MGRRGRTDSWGSYQGGQEKTGNYKKLAARTKPKGWEIEAISLEEELGELCLSEGGGCETVDEEVGDTLRLEEEEEEEDGSFVDIDDTRSND